MVDRPKINAHLDKPRVTIDGKTGEAVKTRTGTFKGFGEGFRDYVLNGVPQVIGAQVNVGQFPQGHPEEGKWAIQIVLSAFDSKELADGMADQVTPIIEGMLGVKSVPVQ